MREVDSFDIFRFNGHQHVELSVHFSKTLFWTTHAKRGEKSLTDDDLAKNHGSKCAKVYSFLSVFKRATIGRWNLMTKHNEKPRCVSKTALHHRAVDTMHAGNRQCSSVSCSTLKKNSFKRVTIDSWSLMTKNTEKPIRNCSFR